MQVEKGEEENSSTSDNRDEQKEIDALNEKNSNF